MGNESKKNTNSDALVSLQKVAKGSFILFIGITLNILLIFIGRLIILRYWTINDYGIYSLGVAILSILSILGSLGLRQGVIRSISYSRGKNQLNKIPELITISLFFSVTTSILVGVFLFLFSDLIAIRLFHESALVPVLKIFAIGLPIFTFIDIAVSIFRGFDDVKPTAIFKFILIEAIFPVLVAFIALTSHSFIYVFYAYVVSIAITCIALIIYVTRQVSLLKIFSLQSVVSSSAKELLIFSLPLLGSTILSQLIFWTDTFMLGGLKTSVEVGLYNAVTPLAQFIFFPLLILIYIYVPIVTGLYATQKHLEIKRTYVILTKWIFISTLPLFLIIFLFSEEIIGFFFGNAYLPSINTLKILSLGYLIYSLFGLNESTILAFGKSKFLMLTSFLGVILNVILNAMLIPFLNIEGAAIASISSLIFINIVRCVKLYTMTGVHPFSKNLAKPAIGSLFVVFSLYLLYSHYFSFKIWMIPIIFILLYIVFAVFVLITKSLDKEDLDILEILRKKTGFKFTFVERLISKFL